jgi:hypothetical protein
MESLHRHEKTSSVVSRASLAVRSTADRAEAPESTEDSEEEMEMQGEGGLEQGGVVRRRGRGGRRASSSAGGRRKWGGVFGTREVGCADGGGSRVFWRLRVLEARLCGEGKGCGWDVSRMVLDRAPRLGRVVLSGVDVWRFVQEDSGEGVRMGKSVVVEGVEEVRLLRERWVRIMEERRQRVLFANNFV